MFAMDLTRQDPGRDGPERDHQVRAKLVDKMNRQIDKKRDELRLSL